MSGRLGFKRTRGGGEIGVKGWKMYGVREGRGEVVAVVL
jgi:hypothetical protein